VYPDAEVGTRVAYLYKIGGLGTAPVGVEGAARHVLNRPLGRAARCAGIAINEVLTAPPGCPCDDIPFLIDHESVRPAGGVPAGGLGGIVVQLLDRADQSIAVHVAEWDALREHGQQRLQAKD